MLKRHIGQKLSNLEPLLNLIFGNFWLVKLCTFSIYGTDVKLTCANKKLVFKGPSVISAIVPVWSIGQWCISRFPSIMFLVSHLFRTEPKKPVQNTFYIVLTVFIKTRSILTFGWWCWKNEFTFCYFFFFLFLSFIYLFYLFFIFYFFSIAHQFGHFFFSV